MRAAFHPGAGLRHVPVEVAFRGIQPSAEAEQELRRNLLSLARSFPELAGCRVLVEPSGPAGDRGPYHVRVDLTLPGDRLGFEVQPSRGCARHELMVLIRDAFDRARRELALRRRHPAVRPPGRLF